MSLRTADSLSNGFENPLESHLHGVDGFFREHTTLPAPEVITLQGGIEGYRTKAGITACFTGSKEHLSCRPKCNECRGWVGLPEDYPLGYGEKTQAILEAFAERIRCPEASRSSQPNGNL